MALTSLLFLILLLGTAIMYYCLPCKIRWIAILIADAFFLYKCNSLLENAIWLAEAAIVYGVAYAVATSAGETVRKALTYVTVIILATTLILLKESTFFGIKDIGVAPIGISYYTLSWITYICGAYWKTGEVQKNPLKFLAFAGFFPILASGPIVKYEDFGREVSGGVKLSLDNITNGAARIAWGFMKKLVIADRIATFINTVYDNPYMYPGLFIWVANAFFIIQLYADFSGCIDIALGAGEMFGFKLPENFNLPFLSQTLEEFWRRWHITLGGWLRDYVLYPILKSGLWQRLTAGTKKRFGKKYGKKIPTWIGLMISWFLVGFWHGGSFNYIFGVGILFGIIIILGDALSPIFDKINKALRINTEAFSWKIFRVLRTWLFFGTGLSFFRAGGLRVGFRNLGLSVSVWNPWIFFDGSLWEMGLDRTEFSIILFFGTVVIIAGILRAVTGKSVRELLKSQNMLFRWLLYAGLVYSVIIYGCYGSGFSSAAFIYQGF
ncbi:MAG: MBOAT family protein [Lachnospiraceae bacterium]|nr:MBOAT family protein [Lachnospiraceae bacterium]